MLYFIEIDATPAMAVAAGGLLWERADEGAGGGAWSGARGLFYFLSVYSYISGCVYFSEVNATPAMAVAGRGHVCERGRARGEGRVGACDRFYLLSVSLLCQVVFVWSG